MAGVAVDRIGYDSIMDSFEMYDCPCFAIFQGKDLKFGFIGGSVEEAKEMFEKNISALHEYSTATYTVKFYKEPDSKGNINKSTPECGSFSFKMRSSSDFEPGTAQLRLMQSNAAHPQIEALTKKVEDLTAALSAVTAVNAEIVEEKQDLGYIGQIVEVIGKDNFNKLIFEGVDMAKGLLGKLLPGLNLGGNAHQAISGIPADVPQEQRLNIALQKMINNDINKANELSDAMYLLVERDPDFRTVLVKLSTMDNATYNMAKGLLK